MNLMSFSDFQSFLTMFVGCILLAFIFYRLVVFISSLILSLVRSIRNRSLIYDSDYINKPTVVSRIGKKTLIDKDDDI